MPVFMCVRVMCIVGQRQGVGATGEALQRGGACACVCSVAIARVLVWVYCVTCVSESPCVSVFIRCVRKYADSCMGYVTFL